MKLVLRRMWLCLLGAVSGLILGAGAWFLFFAYYILLLNSIDPISNTVLRTIGPQICAIIGAISGALIGGTTGFLRFRKQTAMLVFAGANFAIAMIAISDDALITAPANLRTLVIGSTVFHIVTGLIAGWLVSTLYTFVGEVFDGTYRGNLFGFNRENEDEITSLNIAHSVPRRKTAPKTEPVTEPVLEATAEFIEEEAVPELIFEPGRDWDFINGTEPVAASAKFSYVFLDSALDVNSIGKMTASLMPFEAVSAADNITSQQNFKLYKQKAQANPRITYRTDTLKPSPALTAESSQSRKAVG